MSEPLHITDEMLISYLLNEVSADDARQIDEWRRFNIENERRFEQFRLIWESSKNFKSDAGIDAYASLQKVKQRAAEAKEQQVKVVPMRNRFSGLKIAASIIFIAACAWIWLAKFANPTIQIESKAAIRIDTLSDGTIVTLNKNTLFDHPEKFNGDQRLVNLVSGEAFFNVAHNKAKPFIIAAGKASIKVIGTSFNVKSKNGKVEIIVETGLVQVTNRVSDVIIMLKPGEVALFDPQTGKFTQQHTPDNLYQYYRNKNLVFKNIPLARLVMVLNEAYGANIVIGRKELNEVQIAGSFNLDENLDMKINTIVMTLNITAEKKQDKIILK